MYVKQAIFTMLVSTSLMVLALPENPDNIPVLKAGRDEVAARNPSYLNPIARAVEIDRRANMEPRKKKSTPKTTPVKVTPAKSTDEAPAKTTPVDEKTTATPEKVSTSEAPKPTTASSPQVESTAAKLSTSSVVVPPNSSAKEIPSSSSSVASDTQIKTSTTLSATSSALSSSIVPSDTAILSPTGVVTSSALSLSETAPASLISGTITSSPLSSTSSEAEIITTSPPSSAQTQEASTTTTTSTTEPDNTSDPDQNLGPGFTIPDLDYGSLIGLGTSLYGDFVSSSTTDLAAAIPTGNGAGVVTGDPATATAVVGAETLGASGIVPAYSSSFASGVAPAPQVTGTGTGIGVPNARRAWANGLPRMVDTTFFTSTTRAAA